MSINEIIEKDAIIIFADGSSTVFKDSKGYKYGGIGIYRMDKKLKIKKGFRGHSVTNQSMELTACLEAIKNCLCNGDKKKKIIFYLDSMYVINIVTKWAQSWEKNGWKRKENNKLKDISNLDIVKELYNLNNKYIIEYRHVRSHQKEPIDKNTLKWIAWNGNNIVDELAGSSMIEAKLVP